MCVCVCVCGGGGGGGGGAAWISHLFVTHLRTNSCSDSKWAEWILIIRAGLWSFKIWFILVRQRIGENYSGVVICKAHHAASEKLEAFTWSVAWHLSIIVDNDDDGNDDDNYDQYNHDYS